MSTTGAVLFAGLDVEQFAFDELVIDFCKDSADKIDSATLRQYRSDFNVLLLPLFGELWLTECGHNAD